MKVHSLVIATVLACGSVGAQANDPLTFQLDWLPTGEKSFFYAGVVEGYYRDEGIDLKIVPGRGGGDTITRIASGTAELGSAAIGSLMNATAEGGVPVKAVMSIFSKQPDAIFVSERSGITDFKSMQGKTLGLATFSDSNVLLPVMMDINAIPKGSVREIKADASALIPMLAQGRVDGIVIWSTNTPTLDRVMKEAGQKSVLLRWSDYGLEGYGLSIMASDKLIQANPDVVKRFIKATRKVIAFTIANPEKAAADFKTLVPESDEATVAETFRAAIDLIDNPTSKKDGLGQFEPALLNKTWEWLAKSMNYNIDAVDPEVLVARQFLKD